MIDEASVTGAGTESLAAIVAALQTPAAFEHPVDRFEVVETHISYVLLTGPFAYKFKKPVTFAFLDFSTLDNRRAYCEDEVTLNRRLAPDLYVDVVAITGDPRRPAIGGDGPAIEYAVKMVQFDPRERFDRVLARGALHQGDLLRLGADVAAFHDSVPRAGPESHFGDSERLHDEVMGNFEALANLDVSAHAAAVVKSLRRWSARSLVDNGVRFRRRKLDGFVRECHGDLHLANIALVDSSPLAFDCLEFNENLRWTDVMSEVAFLTMDLDLAGRADLSTCFLNAYLEATGDYDGLALLRHYQVYRAMVRAKVSWLRRGQSNRAPDALEEDVVAHLDLAARYAARPRRHPLIVMHGFSGSGKTWLARQLATASGAIRLSSDTERARAPGDAGGGAVGDGRYAPRSRWSIYLELGRLATGVISAGFPAVIDATFLEEKERRHFHHLASDLRVPFRIVAAEAPAEVLERRVAERLARGDDASEADKRVLAYQRRTAVPLTVREDEFARRVDTAAEVDVDGLAAWAAAAPRLTTRHRVRQEEDLTGMGIE